MTPTQMAAHLLFEVMVRDLSALDAEIGRAISDAQDQTSRIPPPNRYSQYISRGYFESMWDVDMPPARMAQMRTQFRRQAASILWDLFEKSGADGVPGSFGVFFDFLPKRAA